MVYTKQTVEHQGKRFEIESDKPEVGVYLTVYENGNCIADSLQDSVELCIEYAEQEYGCPRALWLSSDS